MDSILHKTCLKPSYLLRKQLLLSFGITSLTTLLAVVTIACVFSFQASSNVKARSNGLLEKQALERIFYNSRNVADTFSSYLENIEGTVQIMVEIVQDRIVGYPLDGWERDAHVPFIDVSSEFRANKYPLDSSALPLDWQFESNFDINDNATAEEHLQERARMMLDNFDLFGPVSTATGNYFFQGACDPNQMDRTHNAYMENCTEGNNNIATGGLIQPSSLNQGLYEKSADISVLLKPIYEAQKDALMAGIYFHNQGAGSYVQYPGMVRIGAQRPYTSMGCEWMKETNPYTNQPFGSEYEFARCHPKGVPVQQREYNPNERAWLHHLVLNPTHVNWYGPFYYYDSDLPILLIGRSIFDRITGQFIGCAMLVITLEEMNLFLKKSSNTIEDSEVSVVHFGNGVVLADTIHTVAQPGEDFVRIYETSLISKADFVFLKNCTAEIYHDQQEKCRQKEGQTLPDPLLSPKDNHKCYILKKDTIITAYPIHESSDLGQREEELNFMLIQSIPREILDATTKGTYARIDDEVLSISLLSFAVGMAGMLVVMLFVWYVSGVLTKPLTWMERVAWGIVNHNDKRFRKSFQTVSTFADQEEQMPDNTNHSDELSETDSHRRQSLTDEPQKKAGKYTPSTEIDELVIAFRIMIKGFSGKGASTTAQPDLHEVKNELTWQSDYQKLYSDLAAPATAMSTSPQGGMPVTEPDVGSTNDENRNPSDYQNAQGVDDDSPEIRTADGISPLNHALVNRKNVPLIIPAPPKRNFCNNVLHRSNDMCSKKCVEDEFNNASQIHPYKSSLFWWMLFLIVVPLLITDAAICYFVSTATFQTIPSWVHVVRNQSLQQEIETARSITSVKALEAEMNIQKVVRDLHIMSRVAGWLLFEGIQRSDSFTEMEESTEECKSFPGRTCPFYSNEERAACACNWEDIESKHSGIDCYNYTNMNTRFLQKNAYMVEKRDYDPATGNRYNVTNKSSDRPEETVWWTDYNSMPGHELTSNASGFDNLYSRVRVSSAMSVILIPLYRYTASLHHTRHYMSSMIAFDADGMITGYTGCLHQNTIGAEWESTEANRAAEIAPDLCPIGKHGYDPRCREWYATGKNAYNTSGVPVHITAPFQSALTNVSVASITSPISIPGTASYAGQMHLNFYARFLKFIFRNVDKPVQFLITPERNPDVDDVVVYESPCFSELNSAKILDLLFMHDPSSIYRNEFQENILHKMKSGLNGSAVFYHPLEDGTVEQLTLHFAPIYARVLLPLQPSEFSRGVNISEMHVYTVGIAHREDAITEPWKTVQGGIDDDISKLRAIYIPLVVVVSFLYILITCRNTINITRPMLTLLRVVRTINDGKTENGIPPLQGGSREVLQVYNSFTKLYKIVRVSNVAFFSGNLKWSYEFISDALLLFREVEDDKAIGIACSNLGNTLHAMYHDALTSPIFHEKFDYKNVAESALQHYNEAIRIAEWQLERVEDEESKANFVQQLADRIFNRALLLLLLLSDGFAQEETRDEALRDIVRVRTLDNDLKMFWIDRKLLLGKTRSHFFRLLQRGLGLLEYYEYTKDVWDADDLVREADQLLFASWDKPTAPLFEDVTRIGRLQQLESVAIKLELRKGRNFEAGRLAMRMFAEDEYLIEDAFKVSGNALLTLFRDPNWQQMKSTARTKSQLETDIRRMLKSCRQISIDIQKCLVFAFEINNIHDDGILEQIHSHCLKLYDYCCSADDYMGVIAHTQNGDLIVPLGLKSENEGYQRSSLDFAAISTNNRRCSSYPYIIQMLIDCNASTESDSFVLITADPVGWDHEAFDIFIRQVERLNNERCTKVHVFILGAGIGDPEILNACKSVQNLSTISNFIDLTPDSIDYAFETVQNVIRGGVVSAVYNQGILMEKF